MRNGIKGTEGGSGESTTPKSSRFPLFLSCHLSTSLNDSSHVRAPSSLSFPSSSFSFPLFLPFPLSPSSVSLYIIPFPRSVFLDSFLLLSRLSSQIPLPAKNFEGATCLERDFSTLLKCEPKMAIRNFKLDCASAIIRPGM